MDLPHRTAQGLVWPTPGTSSAHMPVAVRDCQSQPSDHDWLSCFCDYTQCCCKAVTIATTIMQEWAVSEIKGSPIAVSHQAGCEYHTLLSQ